MVRSGPSHADISGSSPHPHVRCSRAHCCSSWRARFLLVPSVFFVTFFCPSCTLHRIRYLFSVKPIPWVRKAPKSKIFNVHRKKHLLPQRGALFWQFFWSPCLQANLSFKVDISLNQPNNRPDPGQQYSRTLNRQPEELIFQAVNSPKEDLYHGTYTLILFFSLFFSFLSPYSISSSTPTHRLHEHSMECPYFIFTFAPVYRSAPI